MVFDAMGGRSCSGWVSLGDGPHGSAGRGGHPPPRCQTPAVTARKKSARPSSRGRVPLNTAGIRRPGLAGSKAEGRGQGGVEHEVVVRISLGQGRLADGARCRPVVVADPEREVRLRVVEDLDLLERPRRVLLLVEVGRAEPPSAVGARRPIENRHGIRVDQVEFAEGDELLSQLRKARLGDRMPALGQGGRAIGRDGEPWNEPSGPIAVVGDDLVAVVPLGEDDLLTCLRRQEFQIDGEWTLTDLHCERLLGVERPAEPFLFPESRRVAGGLVDPSGGVLDDGEQALLGLAPLEPSLSRPDPDRQRRRSEGGADAPGRLGAVGPASARRRAAR